MTLILDPRSLIPDLQPGQDGDAHGIVGGVPGLAVDGVGDEAAEQGVGGDAAGEEDREIPVLFRVFSRFFDGLHDGAEGKVRSLGAGGALFPVSLDLVLDAGEGEVRSVDLDSEVFLSERKRRILLCRVCLRSL